MLKNWPIRIFITLIISLVLTACTFPWQGQKEVVTLKYWGLWDSATVVNQVINDYKALKLNVNVLYEKKSPQQYREALISQIESGKGPDVFQFHNTWTTQLNSQLAPIPSSIISQNDYKNNYYPVIFNNLRNQDKKLVGFPVGIDGLGLYWNEDIFKAAGITSPPATWQQFAETAAKLTVRDSTGSIRTAGAAIGTTSNVDQFSDILALMIIQNGGDLKSPTDKLSADALDYYVHFAKGQNRVWDETMPPSTVAFVGGNLAMYFGPSWRAAEIKNANPLLKFKVAPLPQLEGNKVTWASYWAVGVSAKSTHQQEALEFAKYLQDDQTLIKLYSESAKSPGRFFGQPYPKIALAQKLTSDPIVGAYVSDAPYMRSFSMASRTFDNGLNDQIIKAYEDAVNAVNSQTPTTTALSTAAKNIEKVLAKFSTPAK